MKVLILLRCDAFAKFGGDTFQAQKYRDALMRIGVEVTLAAGVPESFSDCDVVHVFNLDRVIEPYVQMVRAKMVGKPVVLSAVHHPDEWVRFFRARRAPWQVRAFEWVLAQNKRGEVVKDFIRCAAGAAPWAGWWEEAAVMPDALQRKLLRQCDAVTLLAEAEAGWIARDCGVAPALVRVVRNEAEAVGVDETPGEDLVAFCAAHPVFVLVCGRIEPRKNQRGVLNAVAGKYPLVFAGGMNRRAGGYGRAFLREVEETPNAIYTGQLSAAQLGWLYRRAHAHVLFSWFEASPLVDIEAWQAGCHVVTTTRSYAAEYAGGAFGFVDPVEPEALARVLAEVMALPRRGKVETVNGGELSGSWDGAAVKLNALYDEVLATTGKRAEIAWTFPVV
jgi:glycosyltransferase involved in cell wall biosynthesis